MSTRIPILLLSELLLLVACGGSPEGGGGGSGEGEEAATSERAGAAVDTAGAAESMHALPSGDGEALPLRPVMQHLAGAMAGVMKGLWIEDYELMAAYAEGIAGHATLTRAELQRIQAVLGPDAQAFAEADDVVHHAALRLRDAVRARQRDSVVARLAEVQEGCVACHARFRERLSGTAQP